MKAIQINLLKPLTGDTISYPSELRESSPTLRLVEARWTQADKDLGYVVFETGDRFFEYFYSDRWYTIFRLENQAGDLKGWYCNIARPAQFEESAINSEDLALDLYVSPDRSRLQVLDEDEFAALGLDESDPEAHRESLAALAELQHLARTGAPPFDR
jgi:Uncharacterized domain/protein associated with RNAses G and E